MSADNKSDPSSKPEPIAPAASAGTDTIKAAPSDTNTKGESSGQPSGGLTALYREAPPVRQPDILGTKIPAPKPRASKRRTSLSATAQAPQPGAAPSVANAVLLTATAPIEPRLLSERVRAGQTAPVLDHARISDVVQRTPPQTEAEARDALDRTLASLDPSVPLVLLPVRIETRFKGPDLLVRIYPDEIFADAHEPELTADEHRAGIKYWQQSRLGDESGAWGRLVQAYTAPRAAWIRDATPRCTESDGCPRRPASWTRAVEARLLPERWAVTLDPPVDGRRLFVGNRIQDPLALSMKPPESAGEPEDEQAAPLPIDDELRWTIEFNRAVAVGMALRIPVGEEVTHIDRLLVFGVRPSSNPTSTAEELARLFTAHRYTSGLGLVAQGTRTNNSEQGSAGYNADRRDGKRYTSVSSGGDAPYHEESLAAALGVADEVFADLEGGGLREYTNAGDMNLLLWPATLGYYLSRRAEPLVSVSMWDQLRTHFVQWVRGRGPLACFRVGRVPYTVLPVSSLSDWTGSDGNEFEKQIPPLLRAAREVWRRAIPSVPRIVSGSSDPDRDLLEVLGLNASTREVRVRYGLGPQALTNLAALAGLPPEMVDRWCRSGASRVDPRLREHGLLGGLSATVYDDRAPRDKGPLVCAEPLSETAPLPRSNNYLADLGTMSAPELQALDVQNAPLLLVLVRHALLLEFVRIAWDLRVSGGAELVGDARRDATMAIRTMARQREPEIVGANAELEAAPWDAISNAGPWADIFCLNFTGLHDTAAGLYLRSELTDYKRALSRLARCPTAELERVFTETLDLCSHRLDAWVTSLVTHRLAQMRETTRHGCHVGAYCWVEDLRRRTDPVASEGFIHAPSMDHAATSAILRNAFATHRDGSGRFAIDLSSRRVAMAQTILDQVRAGRGLGEVLGAQVERQIHNGHLDRYIDPLRNAYPLVANKMRDARDDADKVAARTVVDGLALHRDFDRALANLIDEADHAFVRALGQDLATSIDAVSDLLTAESVYQLVRGNPAAAGANLDAVARGARPPDPEVVRAPRSGTALTHRVAMVWSPDRPRRTTAVESVRALLEPTLDAWVGRMLGDLKTVECTVSTRPASATSAPTTESAYRVPLSELKLSPLEILAMASNAPTDWVRAVPAGAPANTPPPPPPDELNRRIIEFVERTARAEHVTEIHHGISATGLSFAMLWEVARTLNDVLQQARPLRDDDLRTTERIGTPHGSPLLDAVLDDVTVLIRNFATLCQGLARTTSADLTALRANLVDATRYGLPEAYPTPASFAEAEAQTRAQAQGVLATMLRRLARAANQSPPAATATTTTTLESTIATLQNAAIGRLRGALSEVLEAIFGSKPLLLLPFLPQEPERLRAAYAARVGLGADPPAVRRWMFGASRVRPALARWQKLSLYLSTLGETPSPLDLEIVQLAPRDHSRWIALPFASTEERALPPSGTLALAVHLAEELPSGPWTGLVVDQWVELIPNRRELTGIAFHHDDPGAEAPQTVLLAVPSTVGSPWSTESLQRTLDETLELAKIRGVDAEGLGVLGQFLSTIHLASNTADQSTVSTSFVGRLVEDSATAGGR